MTTTTEPEIQPETPLESPLLTRCRYTPVSVEIDPQTTFEEWGEIYTAHDHAVSHLENQVERANWILGDTILFGEEHFPEDYTQLVHDTGKRKKTLVNIASVCRRIPTHERHDDLSFSVHAALAYVQPEEKREELLKKADEEKLTAAEARKLAKLAKAEKENPPTGQNEPDAEKPAHPSISENLEKLKNDWLEGERRICALVEWFHAQEVSKWSASRKKKMLNLLQNLTTGIEKLAGAETAFRAAFVKLGSPLEVAE